ncbi:MULTISPECIES: Maf family protein [Solibacillus]|uniref:dTTP/UTP pyrophosphatase n=1 Tax=Solibacillus merdavium TaxID=2762218 RepID=A0ABR8XJL0_9BACL|nr:Maf family protein [Solibacillus merdavium]MBD8032116.1 septum formation protein Maf [Solibacillus merdavium]
MNFTTNEQLILASSSPRRKELLQMINIPFTIVTSDVVETSVKANTVQQYVTEVALLKTRDVAKKCPNKCIIGADTIVVFNDQILHKPTSKEEAIQHLTQLVGNRHEVMTAVAIILADGTEHTFVERTAVVFKQVSPQMIEAYVQTGDPFDKAGGYGIQTSGAMLVDRIEGDYNNVVGLPIASLVQKMLTLQLLKLTF